MLEVGKLSTIEKILVAIIAVLGVIIFVRNLERTSSREVDKLAHFPPPEALNLGLTLDSFKKAYNHKAMENELLSLSLDNVTIEEKDDKSRVLCYFGDVVMMIDVDKSSGLVNKISVASEPFTNANRTKKTQILLLQSVVWGLSSMVFNPVMENQQYRESALRRILSNPNTDYMISGNIKIAAIRIDNFLIITIEPRD